MHLCTHLQKHEHPQPLAAQMGFSSTHSFGSMGTPIDASPLEDMAASVASCVTALFPRICCSLQSVNPQAIEKSLHQVTCTHLRCESVPAAPQTAVAPAGVQPLTAFIRPGWRQLWLAGQFLTLSGQVLIIALFHSSISYLPPITNFHATCTLLKLMTSVFQESPCDSPFPFNPPEGHCL